MLVVHEDGVKNESLRLFQRRDPTVAESDVVVPLPVVVASMQLTSLVQAAQID